MNISKAEYIKSAIDRYVELAHRRTDGNTNTQVELLRKLERIFLGEEPFDKDTLQKVRDKQNHEAQNAINNIIGYKFYTSDEDKTPMWEYESDVIKALVHKSSIGDTDTLSNAVRRFISYYLGIPAEDITAEEFYGFLYNQGFTDEDIIESMLAFNRNIFFTEGFRTSAVRRRRGEIVPENLELNAFGKHLLSLLEPQKGFLGLKKKDGMYPFINERILKDTGTHMKFTWLVYQYTYYPDQLDKYIKEYLVEIYWDKSKRLNYGGINFLIEKDAAKYEKLVLQLANEINCPKDQLLSILFKLNEKLNKYEGRIREICDDYFTDYFSEKSLEYKYIHELHTSKGLISAAYAGFLFEKNEEEAKSYLMDYIKKSKFVFPTLLTFLEEKLGEACLPYMIEALFKEPSICTSRVSNYYTTLLGIFDKYKVFQHLERFIEFATQYARREPRQLVCKMLARYQPDIIPVATDLLRGKVVNQRIVGALILSEINTTEVEKTLNEVIDTEPNDDTRDVMLEALAEKRFKKPFSLKEVKEMVSLAGERKKLSRWSEKWLSEESLPKIYYNSQKQALSQEEVRFLFYRMKRVPGLNSDIEAKELIRHIDKEKSEPFAKALLAAFQESNADTRIKYYLTLAGLLGADGMTQKLNTIFRKSIADKRVKIAEYIVGALAMVGTDKALRSVEVIYRKMANKKPRISEAAKAALDAAAKELNLTMDELSDRIIPDFDFEGLYKSFVVEDIEYRAFINADFKLNFFDEDNKLRKTVPANTPKELKTMFREIEKEVRDVVKSQSGRLEKYMIEERKWKVPEWKQFFFENPIMFIYSMKLPWAVFNEKNELTDTFYCSEDACVYNLSDEELELNENHYIGIVHPALLTNELIQSWKDKLYEMGLVTIFPVFERKTFSIADSEKGISFTKHFYEKEVAKGADFVNSFLVKKNWIKSSGDGGRSEFVKLYKDGLFRAYANIDGPAAFYQGGNVKATVYEIQFMEKNWQEKLKLADVPPIFYSEVMADIDELIATE